jgi:hypothetical protein
MASQVTRFAWTDDSGTPSVPVGNGTKINNAQLQLIFDAVDGLFASGTFTLGGLLLVEGGGVHRIRATTAGPNVLAVQNLSASAAAYADVRFGNSLADNSLAVGHLSSTYTTVAYYVADRSYIIASRPAGLVLSAEHASGVLHFGAGGVTTRGRVLASGRLAWDSGYATSGLSIPTGLEIGGGGASPNIAQMIFGDGSGYNLRIGTQVAGTFESRLTVDDRGYVQAPKQPGFFAYNSATDAGVANNTAIDFDTEVYDELGNFAGDTFTAPVTGRYLLSACVCLANLSGGTLTMQAVIAPSNHATGINIGYSTNVANTVEVAFSGAVVVDMDAGDTAVVKYYGGGAASVRGDATQRYTWFSGRLLV